MMTTPPPRTYTQRKQDTVERLERDVDAWVATAGPDGRPHMIPLSYLWDGTTVLLATAAASVTSRNLLANGAVRVGIGPTRDVILIEGTVEVIPDAEIPDALGDAFAVRTEFDPRKLTAPYFYLRVHPGRLRAWREENELAERDLMRGGRWLDETP
jgi:general stress protein 26